MQYKTVSSRIISLNYTLCSPHLTKNVPLLSCCVLPQPCMDCPTPSPKPTIQGKRCRWRENPDQQQKNAHYPLQKIPFTKQQFSCNHPKQASFIAVVIAVVSYIFFLTSGFMCVYNMLILISRWLLDLTCCMTKALNGKKFLQANSQPPSAPFKTLLQLQLVFLFTPFLFHFKLYKFLLTPLQL